jgi:hypothetical protein
MTADFLENSGITHEVFMEGSVDPLPLWNSNIYFQLLACKAKEKLL